MVAPAAFSATLELLKATVPGASLLPLILNVKLRCAEVLTPSLTTNPKVSVRFSDVDNAFTVPLLLFTS